MVSVHRFQVSGFRLRAKATTATGFEPAAGFFLAISAHSRAYSGAGSDECRLADGISIFRQE
jgi:hypothetical protein